MYINSLVSSTVHAADRFTFERSCSFRNEETLHFVRVYVCNKNCIIYSVFMHKNPLHVIFSTYCNSSHRLPSNSEYNQIDLCNLFSFSGISKISNHKTAY